MAVTRGQLVFLVFASTLQGLPATAATKVPIPKNSTKTAVTSSKPSGNATQKAPALPPQVFPAPGAKTVIATANRRLTPAYRRYGDKTPFVTFDAQKRVTGQLIFTVLGRQGNYLIVNLPSRPNGSIGFVEAKYMNLTETDTLITVSLSTRELVAYRGETEILRTPAAVGQTKFPTPKGIFYSLEVAKLKNPDGPYGPYALGLSGFSNVLTEFGRGDGQIAIHGTNQPTLLGQPASHGCIRVSNEIITRLVQEFPLGVPVAITE
jgi:lipoprotein-anchoring transpeptidase ErfK/SrfK